jgi:hypothetical protein
MNALLQSIIAAILSFAKNPRVQMFVISLLCKLRLRKRRKKNESTPTQHIEEKSNLKSNINLKNEPKMDFISKILAQIFEKFKQSNPVVASIIALVMIVTVYTAEQGTLLGVFELPIWASDTLKWISTIVLALNGTKAVQKT